MIQLRRAKLHEAEKIMEIIDMAKAHLKQQGINQWQSGYPDRASVEGDILTGKGFFLVDDAEILGYLCADYDGEPAYNDLQGEWQTEDKYVVVHRMAFADSSRGKGISDVAFRLVEEMSKEKGVDSFRIDTDAANKKMQHVLKKNGFEYRGTVVFDGEPKIAFDKKIV